MFAVVPVVVVTKAVTKTFTFTHESREGFRWLVYSHTNTNKCQQGSFSFPCFAAVVVVVLPLLQYRKVTEFKALQEVFERFKR